MSAEEIVRGLLEMLPPKVDYAKLVCAEGFAHGQCYVWGDPEPYIISEAADLIESLAAQLEELEKRRRQAALNYQQKCLDVMKLEAQLAASQQETRAAVDDFTSAAHNGNILCEFCGADCIDAGCDTGGDTDQCGMFVWRGPQEAGKGAVDEV